MKYHMNRLFGKSENCLDVAIDHGLFNEKSFLGSIENMEKAIQTIVDAQPDAIQLTVGQVEILQRMAGKDKPALVLRTDVANCYNPEKRGRQSR
jgi:class I fructose-bisphosphate aldolase